MTDQRLTLTVEEAARLLGCGRATAYLGIKSGEIPALRVGRRILVPRARLLALLGELPAGNAAEGGGQIEEANGPDASPSASDRGDLHTALEP